MNQIQNKILQSKRDSIWSDEARGSFGQPWFEAHTLGTMRQKAFDAPELFAQSLTHDFDIFKFADTIGR
jgi:hypothetical protein